MNAAVTAVWNIKKALMFFHFFGFSLYIKMLLAKFFIPFMPLLEFTKLFKSFLRELFFPLLNQTGSTQSLRKWATDSFILTHVWCTSMTDTFPALYQRDIKSEQVHLAVPSLQFVSEPGIDMKMLRNLPPVHLYLIKACFVCLTKARERTCENRICAACTHYCVQRQKL